MKPRNIFMYMYISPYAFVRIPLRRAATTTRHACNAAAKSAILNSELAFGLYVYFTAMYRRVIKCLLLLQHCCKATRVFVCTASQNTHRICQFLRYGIGLRVVVRLWVRVNINPTRDAGANHSVD